jgi:dUTP pyrophosphatase
MVEVPVLDVREVDYDDLLKVKSERGTGALGSSGK